MSELDIAKKLFGAAQSSSSSSSNTIPSKMQYVQTQGTQGYTSTRYGTIEEIGEGNYLTILLDGSQNPIKAYCETPVKTGQRVSVVFDSGTVTVIALSNFVEKTEDDIEEVRNEINTKGQEILDSVKADIEEVSNAANNAVANAEEAKKKADEAAGAIDGIEVKINDVDSKVGEISTSVSGAVETAESASSLASSTKQDLDGFKTEVSQSYVGKEEASSTYATKTELSQTSDSILSSVSEVYETKADADAAIAQEVLDRNSAIEQSASQITSTVSQNYQSKTEAGEMESKLQSQITQNADSIAQEVSDRKTAVSGAIDEAKSYTNQTAEGISSTVESNVMNAVGETYATKSEVQQTTEGIKITLTQSIEDVDSKAEAAKSAADTAKSTADSASEAASNAQSTANSAQSTANSASSTANSANSTANSALSKANNASTEASNAAKTATDYLSYTSSGLQIGSSNIDTSVLVAPDGVKFKNGTTILSEYNNDGIVLGNPIENHFEINSLELRYVAEPSGNNISVIGCTPPYRTYFTANSTPIFIDCKTTGGVRIGSNMTSNTDLGAMTVYENKVTFNSLSNLSVSSNVVDINGSYVAEGMIVRTRNTDFTLSSTNTTFSWNTTIVEYDEDNLFYTAPNYIRVKKPTGFNSLYVKVSVDFPVQGLTAGQNVALDLMKGTSSSVNSATGFASIITNGGGGILTGNITPTLVQCTSTYTYFFLQVRSTGGGGWTPSYSPDSGGCKWAPRIAVEIVGGN